MTATARDALLTAAVAALTAVALPAVVLLGAASGEPVPGAGATAVLTAVCVVQCLPLLVRRSHPRACLLLVAALQVAVVAASPDDVGARGAAPLLAAYAVGSLLPERVAARAVLAAVLVELVGTLAVTVGTGGVVTGLVGVVGGTVTYVAAALVGAHVATRRRYAELERRRAAEAVAAQEDRVRSAVAEVRAGMARELHDIAAHHLSAMVVQATAASRLVERDPAAAREGCSRSAPRGAARSRTCGCSSACCATRTAPRTAPRCRGSVCSTASSSRRGRWGTTWSSTGRGTPRTRWGSARSRT